jgi:hypothetical protein
MAKLPSQEIRDIGEGIIQAVDPSVCPKNSLALAVNFIFDKILGRAVLRGGTSQLGSQIVDGKPILGLYEHITAAGTKVPIAIVDDSAGTNADIFTYNGSAWVNSHADITAGAKCRFLTFLDTTVAFNGTDKLTTANGTTWVHTGGNFDAANLPVGTMGCEWQDKIYVAGISATKNRLVYSTTPTGGAIAWSGGNSGNMDIEPEEGAGPICALAKTPGYLMILKERSLKRWDGSSTYPESLVKVGTYSQENVVMGKQSVYYFNKRGIFETAGAYPRKISRRIQDIIEAIPSTSYSSVNGWCDEEHVYFAIGNITIYDQTLDNCVICYSIDSQNWTLLSFPFAIKHWSQLIDTYGDESIIVGDSDGNVWNMFDGDDDSGTAINWMIRYQTLEFGNRGRTKDLSKFVVYSKNASGIMLARANETGNFNPMGNISKPVNELTCDLHGNYFEIQLQGKGKNVQIIGIEFPEININENYGD